jgi:diacylglycerol kinase family enzyme
MPSSLTMSKRMGSVSCSAGPFVKAVLFHNAASGSEDHTDDELVRVIRRAGHEVTRVARKVDELLAELQREPCDLVVVAGGDGTVGRAACELAQWGVPLAILPLGTANNLALALGIEKYSRKLAEGWHAAAPLPFDLALVDDGDLRSRFAEGFGWGVFTQTIALAKKRPDKGRRRRRLERGRALFAAVAAAAVPRSYELDIDGTSHSGDYLMVEVLNISLLGARMCLSPRSDPSDGQLEVVLARPEDRAALISLAETGMIAEGALMHLPAQRVRVRTDEGVSRCDGHLLRHRPQPRTFDLQVKAGAIHCLRGPAAAELQ